MPMFRKKPVVIEAVQLTWSNWSENDWIIKGVNGEFYPCKPYIFEKTYEPEETQK
jgi:hypothetical protein